MLGQCIFKINQMIAGNLNNFTTASITNSLDGVDISFKDYGFYPIVGVKQYEAAYRVDLANKIEDYISIEASMVYMADEQRTVKALFKMI